MLVGQSRSNQGVHHIIVYIYIYIYLILFIVCVCVHLHMYVCIFDRHGAQIQVLSENSTVFDWLCFSSRAIKWISWDDTNNCIIMIMNIIPNIPTTFHNFKGPCRGETTKERCTSNKAVYILLRAYHRRSTTTTTTRITKSKIHVCNYNL